MPTNCDNEWFVGPVPVSKAYWGTTQVYPCADDPGPDPIFGDAVAVRDAIYIGPSWYTSNNSLRPYQKDGKWGVLGYKNDPFPNEIRPLGLDGIWGPSWGNYAEGGWSQSTHTMIWIPDFKTALHEALDKWNNGEGKRYENFNYDGNFGITLQAVPEVIWKDGTNTASYPSEVYAGIQLGDYTLCRHAFPTQSQNVVPPPLYTGWIHANKKATGLTMGWTFCWAKTSAVRAGARQAFEAGEWDEKEFTSFMRSLDG